MTFKKILITQHIEMSESKMVKCAKTITATTTSVNQYEQVFTLNHYMNIAHLTD